MQDKNKTITRGYTARLHKFRSWIFGPYRVFSRRFRPLVPTHPNARAVRTPGPFLDPFVRRPLALVNPSPCNSSRAAGCWAGGNYWKGLA